MTKKDRHIMEKAGVALIRGILELQYAHDKLRGDRSFTRSNVMKEMDRALYGIQKRIGVM